MSRKNLERGRRKARIRNRRLLLQLELVLYRSFEIGGTQIGELMAVGDFNGDNKYQIALWGVGLNNTCFHLANGRATTKCHPAHNERAEF